MRKATMWTVAVAIAVGAVFGPAAPAQAYDRGTCERHFGAARIQSVRQFNHDLGQGNSVDFGDHPHWGGAPQGTAVICWLTQGGVALFGRVFADNMYGRACAKVEFLGSTGQTPNRGACVGGAGSGSAPSTSIEFGITTSSPSFTQVRLTLSRTVDASNPDFQKTYSRP